jgi:Xaa-Pro dipeptidase
MNPRFARLFAAMQAEQLEGVALNPGPTLTYLTGLNFHLMERPTLLLAALPDKIAVVLAELEKGKTDALGFSAFTFNDNPATWGEVFTRAVNALGLNGKRIGIEPIRLRFLELRLLEQAAPAAQIISGEGALGSLRLCKDAQEIMAMRSAVQIAQNALLATLPVVKPGVTEREVASELCLQLLRAGSDPELPFAPIVAGGPNSANPHAVPTERRLTPGDLLVIDWGAAYHGYFSDLTRTFAIGEVEPEFKQIAELTARANAAGRAAGKPGLRAGDVDRAARQVIDSAGYGAAFFHRTGHGLGMEGHEPPYMFAENDLMLQEGMTYTVEPGIYLTGRGGVRVEDDVVITPSGCETLSDLPRNLIHLG